MLKALLQRLGVAVNDGVRRQAEETLRVMETKIHPGSLKKAEAARPAVALECAFRQCGEAVPPELAHLVGVPPDGKDRGGSWHAMLVAASPRPRWTPGVLGARPG